MKKTLIGLTALLLAACGDQQSQLQNELDNTVRSQIAQQLTEQCLARIPQNAAISDELRQKVCTCGAEETMKSVKAEDLGELVGGNAVEKLQQYVASAAQTCTAKLLNPEAASSVGTSAPSESGNDKEAEK